MPYKRVGKKVINTETGESKGTSETVEKAKAHMRALYAHEPKKKMKKREHGGTIEAKMEKIRKERG